MRWKDGQKDATRQQILSAAGALFRERGYANTSVADVMTRADRTVGGFYAHFDSKAQLLAEVLKSARPSEEASLFAGLAHASGAELVRELTRRYLSTAHRDGVADGCPLPSLSVEAGRLGDGPREELTGYLRTMTGMLAERGAPSRAGMSPEQVALAVTSLSVGGLLLARAVADPQLSNEILRACKRLAAAEVDVDAPVEQPARERSERAPS